MLSARFSLPLLCLLCSVCNHETDADNSIIMGEGGANEWDEDDEYMLGMSLPGAEPQKDQDYLCSTFEITEPGYVVEFIPVADKSRVHHMLVFGCDKPRHEPGTVWNCKSNNKLCLDSGYSVYSNKKRYMFNWARNAPSLRLPKDVSVPIAGEHGPKYLIVQVHYAKKFIGKVRDYSGLRLRVRARPTPNLASIMFLASTGSGSIPNGTDNHVLKSSCEYKQQGPAHPFAFRVHSHNLGVVISSYKHAGDDSTGDWSFIGKANPRFPQWYYPVENKSLVINPGDQLLAQCRYNSTTRNTITKMGKFTENEMCNMWIYYYTPTEFFNGPAKWCISDKYRMLSKVYPAYGNEPVPPNPSLLEAATLDIPRFEVSEVTGWHVQTAFGEIVDMEHNSNGNLVVLHRANRKWDAGTFDDLNNYQLQDDGPIDAYTVSVLDVSTGKELQRWGKSIFYMPHGLFIDEDDSIWVTDVALHQVFKFSPIVDQAASSKLMVLGKAFEPGNDREHFCQPTDLVVVQSELFVADGYCNTRVVVFDAQSGAYLRQFAKQTLSYGKNPPLGTLSLPHSLAYDRRRDVLYVADKDNKRIQSFNREGEALQQFVLSSPVYAVAYCEAKDQLYAVNGDAEDVSDIRISAVDPDTMQQLYSWMPSGMNQSFTRPHALAIAVDCNFVFMGETGPNTLWKFNDSISSMFTVLTLDTAYSNRYQPTAFLTDRGASFKQAVAMRGGNDKLAKEWLMHLAKEPVTHLANEPVAHLAKEPVTHWAKKPATHWAKESATHLAKEPITHLAKEPATHLTLSLIIIAISIPLLCITICILCILYRKKGGTYNKRGPSKQDKNGGVNVGLLSGYKPLRTTESSSSEDSDEPR